MKTKKERILLLLDYYADGNKEKFGRLVGISGTAVSLWLKKGDFNAERIINNLPEVNPHWLRTGEGEMIRAAAVSGISQTIGNGNTNAYNIAGSSGDELAKLKAENETLKEELKWFRFMFEKYFKKSK